MSRKLIVAGNWKMNLNLGEAAALARGVEAVETVADVEVALFPTFPWIVPVREALGQSNTLLGAQDCYTEVSGAYTGEVSPQALAEVCEAVLAGHSERRHVIGESNELVGRKVRAIVDAGMTAYLCVGETLEEREAGAAEEIVAIQLETGLEAITAAEIHRIVIAYEPVWAIGTGVAASTADAQAMCETVRAWMSARFGDDGGAAQVLYGGSVSPANVDELFACPDIDGGLVGGASLSVDSFSQLIEAANRLAAV